MRTLLWQLQSGQVRDTTNQVTLPQQYVTTQATTLDQLSGFVTQLGSPPGTILPVNPTTIGVDIPFFYFDNTANEDIPWPRVKRRRDLRNNINAVDFGLHITLGPLTAPPDTSLLFFSGNYSDDLVPLSSRARNRKNQLQASSQSQLNVTGIFTQNINSSVYAAISCDLLTEIQRHLLEPIVDDGVTWSLWTQDEVLSFFTMRLQRFMLETGIIRKSTNITAASGDLPYPIDLIEARRVETYDGSNYSSLEKVDALMADNYFLDWPNNPGTPVAYIEEPKIALTFTLVPPPLNNTTLNLIYVPLPGTITSHCTNLPIPNIFANYIKWGTIADMLSKEGEANDPVRAEVAESRFREGIELARVLLGTKR